MDSLQLENLQTEDDNWIQKSSMKFADPSTLIRTPSPRGEIEADAAVVREESRRRRQGVRTARRAIVKTS
jgi:hypothetical protein